MTHPNFYNENGSPLSIGDRVCRNTDNTFGIVTKVDGMRIWLTLPDGKKITWPKNHLHYMPTHEQIEERAAAIRATWTYAEAIERKLPLETKRLGGVYRRKNRHGKREAIPKK